MTERRLRQKRGMGLSAQLHVCLVSCMNVSLLSVSMKYGGFKETKELKNKKFKCCICPN